MYSPWLRCHIEGRWEALQVLWFYEKRVLPDAYYFYMRSVKSLQRMPQKLYWSHWYDARNRGSAVLLRDLESRQRRSGEWGGRTVEEAARNYPAEVLRMRPVLGG